MLEKLRALLGIWKVLAAAGKLADGNFAHHIDFGGLLRKENIVKLQHKRKRGMISAWQRYTFEKSSKRRARRHFGGRPGRINTCSHASSLKLERSGDESSTSHVMNIVDVKIYYENIRVSN
jgi:hypothetical protein